MTHYVEATYNKIADAYAKDFFDDLAPDLPFLKLLLDHCQPDGHLLDIGCGPGQFTNYLLKQGFKAEGIDSSEAMLTVARAKTPQARFTKMDMRHLQYPDTTFDGVLAIYSIIHVPTPEVAGVLKEVRRVLKTGAHALLVVQVGTPDHLLDEPLAKGEKVFVNFFSEARLEALVHEAELDVVQTIIAPQASAGTFGEEVIAMLTRRPA